MQKILAIDAGGTSTRAALVDASGQCLGFGAAGAGNPVSAGFDSALASITAASRIAVAVADGGSDRRAAHPVLDPDDVQQPGAVSLGLIAMAGASISTTSDVIHAIQGALASLGLAGTVEVVSDLLAIFHSGTLAADGYALVAGTGSVAARITDGELDAVSGGAGWLLGDAGSGYWIGHQVARAVVASLDGRASGTALTGLLLGALGLERRDDRSAGRPLVLLQLIDALYAMRPVELSRFAPLAFQAATDPVARSILTEAATELAETLAAIRTPQVQGPVVLGGSVLGAAMLAADTSPMAAALETAWAGCELVTVKDGLIGAAMLGLKRAGVPVNALVFDRMQRTIMAQR